MRVVILGCGRVGSTLAIMLDSSGHSVTIIDQEQEAFRRLGEQFGGRAILGVGIDEEVLREAEIVKADAFLAVTNGDNTNVMAAQIAKTLLGVPRVMARIYDPLRAQVYRDLGIETIAVTMLGAGLLFDRLLERPLGGIEHYLGLTQELHRLYRGGFPLPTEPTAHRGAPPDARPRYIIVAGGGKVGHQLTRELLRQNYEVLLTEKRGARYELLRAELGDAVYRGDACEIRTMVGMGLERADLVVAVTGDDEDNLVICQVAKRWFGVPRTIARINNPRNEAIFRKLGIDETISATTLLFQLIEQTVATSDLVPLVLLRRGALEVVEVELSGSAPVIGKTVRELTLPAGSLLGAVVRGSEAEVVTGDTVLHIGDTVVALAHPATISQLRQALVG